MTRNVFILCLVATLPVRAAELPDTAGDRHLGVATCAASQCHGSAVGRDATAVLQNEYVTWTSHDPHAAAYRSLQSDASRAIAARLGLPNAHTAGICLDCHADNVPASIRGERFQLSDGVGCEACHGGAERWLDTHYNTPAVTHEDNVGAGLYPADDAGQRARLCQSCHVGSETKLATHRIMAAGHPRLSFELDTFTELWRTAGGMAHYRVDEDYDERKQDPSHVRLWATGMAGDARRRLALLQAGDSREGELFPELALYDCHACHRSMQSIHWRRLARHGDAPPGQPFVADGSFVMTLVLARALQPGIADELQASLAALHAAGDRRQQAAAVAALDGLVAELARDFDDARLRNRQAAILEALLTAGAGGEYLDYGSAEQAFMAVQMLAFEMRDDELQSALDKLASELDDDERYRPGQFAALLRELR